MLSLAAKLAPSFSRDVARQSVHRGVLLVPLRAFHDSPANNQQQQQQQQHQAAGPPGHFLQAPSPKGKVSYREQMAREYARNLIREAQNGRNARVDGPKK